MRLHALLDESPRWTGGKQRLTAARLHQMIVAEGFAVGAKVVKEVVAEWKRSRREVFVPLVYEPGELAEGLLRGPRRCRHRAPQGVDGDGHVRAFAFFGAVPQRIAYDNLEAAGGARARSSPHRPTSRHRRYGRAAAQ